MKTIQKLIVLGTKLNHLNCSFRNKTYKFLFPKCICDVDYKDFSRSTDNLFIINKKSVNWLSYQRSFLEPL